MIPRERYTDAVRRTALDHGKMAFVTGPRQVGKTTLARAIAGDDGIYHACDDLEFRRRWVKDPKTLIPASVGRHPTIVFDELHKAPRWKRYLKVLFDTRGEDAAIVVTGSARLDVYRRGGDSMLGRYFAFRLHPFTAGELGGAVAGPDDLAGLLDHPIADRDGIIDELLRWGGFPEPLQKRDPAFLRLWRRTRTERLVREDLLDLSRVQELSLIETAATMLADRVGSPFSTQALAEDLQVAHRTAGRWLDLFARLYLAYRVPPYARGIGRALRKQPKVYLWDWSEVPGEGARFENLVAGHLTKLCHFFTDTGIGTFELCYLRDKERREVDFLVLRDRKPWLMAEAKTAEVAPSAHLRRFAALLRPALVLQIVAWPGAHERFDLPGRDRGLIVSAGKILPLLP